MPHGPTWGDVDARARLSAALEILKDTDHDVPSLDPLSVDAAEWTPILEWGARFAERYKHVTFPKDASGPWPVLEVKDERIAIDVLIPPRPDVGRDGVSALARAAARHFGEPVRPRVIALDYHASAHVTEVALENWVYGVATLYAWPEPAPEPTDPRILKAQHAGWGTLMRETNLRPHNRMVIEGGNHGVFLEDDAFADVAGVVAWLPKDTLIFEANPFVARPRNDPELVRWFSWERKRAEALGCG